MAPVSHLKMRALIGFVKKRAPKCTTQFFVAIFSCLKNGLSKGNPIRTISLRNARMLGQVYHHVTSISLRRQMYKVFLRPYGRSGGVHFSSERLSLASTNCQRGGHCSIFTLGGVSKRAPPFLVYISSGSKSDHTGSKEERGSRCSFTSDPTMDHAIHMHFIRCES